MKWITDDLRAISDESLNPWTWRQTAVFFVLVPLSFLALIGGYIALDMLARQVFP